MMPRMQASFSTWLTVLSLGVVLILGGLGSFALEVDPAAINALMRSLEGPEASELPMVARDDDGFVLFLGAPPQARFIPPVAIGKPLVNAETVAKEFMSYHGGSFGLDFTEMELRTRNIVEKQGGSFVRLDQYYAGLPVLGAQVIVHVDGTLSVQNINADIMRDTEALDQKHDFLTPIVTPAGAIELAVVRNAEIDGEEPDAFVSVSDPELVIFDPKVFSRDGGISLAWKVRLRAQRPTGPGSVLLMDAHTGEMVLRYGEGAAARQRHIFDVMDGWDLEAAPLARAEGDPPTGIASIDRMYDYLGKCYDWYMDQHARDSYDNRGSIIRGYANYPILNAYWDPYHSHMVMGTLFLSLDVVAHEYTHGVTEADADLIYYSYSGAINEMYSDQAGEFIELANRDNPYDERRWWLGEDMDFWLLDMKNQKGQTSKSQPVNPEILGMRYMRDPTVLGDPDRLGSPLLVDPYDWFDYGGVHFNSGIGNKLVYLLTDGDAFNGQVVQGMGMSKVADLFYAARSLLSRSANYFDFYYALRAASVLLDFTEAERLNVIAGARAVEIEPPNADSASLLGLREFRAVPTHDVNNEPVIGLAWKNPNLPSEGGMPPPVQITLYRGVTDFPSGGLDGLLLPVDHTDTAYLDFDVQAGEWYYYTLVAEIGTFTQMLHAKAQAGVAGMNVYTEVFGHDLLSGTKPFDLSYSQITFRPVLPPPDYGDDPYLSAMDFSDYEATITKPVYDFPVRRNDGGTGAWNLTYSDDGWIPLGMGERVFPFFGVPYSTIFLSSNGYIVFADLETLFGAGELLATLDMPTLAAHFALPRLSFLFADLAPHISGQVWAKDLDDRLVITLENVAVKPPPATPTLNPDRVTVQVELFDSGHIRITYLSVVLPSGIVGLSDGRGVPRDPADLFGGIREGYRWVDLSALPGTPSRMSINPIATQFVSGGGTIAFDATAELPPALPGNPIFYASWDGPGEAPFADNLDGSGSFYWETRYEDAGLYTVRIFAELGGQRVFQDVRLVVGRVLNIKPVARNLQISTTTAGEDPTVSRSVSIGLPLIGSFEYYHPYQNEAPMIYGPGATLLYWFRNGQVVTAFTNSLTIPPNVLRADDVWWFQVTPQTRSGLKGDTVTSPIINVLGAPRVNEVFPNQGLTTGGERITIRGSQLTNASRVTFGGVPGSNLRVTGSNELSVVTPVHAAGTVTVAVETPGGVGRKLDAFTFVGDREDPWEEKQRRVLGCGPRDGGPTSLLYDLFPAAVVLLLLAAVKSARKKPCGG